MTFVDDYSMRISRDDVQYASRKELFANMSFFSFSFFFLWLCMRYEYECPKNIRLFAQVASSRIRLMKKIDAEK